MKLLRPSVCVCVIAVALACGWTMPARADDDPAKQAYKRGQTAYDLGEYRQALDAFKEGYRLKADPFFLYNVAQCHRQLGENAEAVKLYRSYLRNAPKAKNRAEVERRIKELEARPAVESPAAAAPPPGPLDAPAQEHPAAAPPVVLVPAPTPPPQPPAAPRATAPAPATTPPEVKVPPAPPDPVAPARADLVAAPTAAPAETPFYRKSMFWVGVGAGLGAAALLIALVTPAAEPSTQTTLGTYRPTLR